MDRSQTLQLLADKLGASATVKSVFGEPITAGAKTIIPVAKVSYGFGGGSGARQWKEEGGGGGGGVRATPVGVVEVTGEVTRFIPVDASRQFAVAALVGLGLGLVVARLLHSKEEA